MKSFEKVSKVKKARTVLHYKSGELNKQPNSRELPFISQESVEEGAPLLFSPLNNEATPGEPPVIFQKSVVEFHVVTLCY